MKPYKLKHIPTGLYYQPCKHRGSHLSKKGKVYQSKNNGLSYYFNNELQVYINCMVDSNIYKSTKDILNWKSASSWYVNRLQVNTKISEWKIEEL